MHALSQSLPLHVHASPQLSVPSSVDGSLTRLLPLHLDVFVPPSVRKNIPFECNFVSIRVEAPTTDSSILSAASARTVVACVSLQPPAYLDQSSLPSPDALVISDTAQRIFFPHTMDASSPPRVTFTPLPSHSLPLWQSIQLRVLSNRRSAEVVRDLPATMHPLFPLASSTSTAAAAAESSAAIVRPALSHVRRQLVNKPLFARHNTCAGVSPLPLLLLFPDGCYRAVEIVRGIVHPMYVSASAGNTDAGSNTQEANEEDFLRGWGMVGTETQLSWSTEEDKNDTQDLAASSTISVAATASSSAAVVPSLPSRRLSPLDLSINDLFRCHLSSFVEGVSTSADDELKNVALLIKMFALEGGGASPLNERRRAGPPSLIHPRSLLLSGPAGTGKKSFLSSLAHLFGMDLLTLSFGKLITRRNVASQTEALRAELEDIRARFLSDDGASSLSQRGRKCMLLLPGLDLTCAAVDERDEDAMAMQNELLSFLREVNTTTANSSCSLAAPSPRVLVVGITNARSRLSPLLVQSFQFRFATAAPTDAGRGRILRAHLGLEQDDTLSADSFPISPALHAQALPFDARALDLGWVVEQTQGFVGADLVALVKAGVAHALQRHRQTHVRNATPNAAAGPIKITNEDFQFALSRVHPASLKALNVIAKPVVALPAARGSTSEDTASASSTDSASAPFSQIGGLSSVKRALREALQWPLVHGTAFRRLGIAPPRGMLLYGVPGVGKTLLCKHVARELRVNFIVASLADILQSGVGESEKRVQALFARARALAPSVIFLDEIQSVFAKGGGNDEASKLMAQLLHQIDALNDESSMASTDDNGSGSNSSSVFLLAATNLPSAIDPSLLRAGRLDRVLYVGPPDAAAREEILLLEKKNAHWSEELLARRKELVGRMEGFSAVDVVHLVRCAGLCALQRSPSARAEDMEVTWADFESALRSVTPSITPAMVDTCVQWGRKFTQRHAKRRQRLQAQAAIDGMKMGDF